MQRRCAYNAFSAYSLIWICFIYRQIYSCKQYVEAMYIQRQLYIFSTYEHVLYRQFYIWITHARDRCKSSWKKKIPICECVYLFTHICMTMVIIARALYQHVEISRHTSRDSCICVTRLIPRVVANKNIQTYECIYNCIRIYTYIWYIYMYTYIHIYMRDTSNNCTYIASSRENVTQHVTSLIHMWRDSFIYACEWLLHICVMT